MVYPVYPVSIRSQVWDTFFQNLHCPISGFNLGQPTPVEGQCWRSNDHCLQYGRIISVQAGSQLPRVCHASCLLQVMLQVTTLLPLTLPHAYTFSNLGMWMGWFRENPWMITLFHFCRPNQPFIRGSLRKADTVWIIYAAYILALNLIVFIAAVILSCNIRKQVRQIQQDREAVQSVSAKLRTSLASCCCSILTLLSGTSSSDDELSQECWECGTGPFDLRVSVRRLPLCHVGIGCHQRKTCKAIPAKWCYLKKKKRIRHIRHTFDPHEISNL